MPIVTGGTEERAVGSGQTTATPPPPPPTGLPPAAAIPAAIRCVPAGPLGLESPASSTVTELLSPTVKGPFEPSAEEKERSIVDELDELLTQNEAERKANLETAAQMEVENSEEPPAQANASGTPQPPPYLPNPDLYASGSGGSGLPEVVPPPPFAPRHPSELLPNGLAVMAPMPSAGALRAMAEGGTN